MDKFYKKCFGWFRDNFWEQAIEHTQGSFVTPELACGITLNETAYKWGNWIDKYDKETVLARCVFDTCGDTPGTLRSAFPVNRKAFQDIYGTAITDKLVYEYNLTRKMPQPGYPNGYKSEVPWIAKGYGLYQYDLQHFPEDPAFFTEKRWYNFSDCMIKLVEELHRKARIKETEFSIVKAYNGGGKPGSWGDVKSTQYAKDVLTYRDAIKKLI